MNSVRLYQRFTMDQLIQKQSSIADNPENVNMDGGIALHTPKTRRELAAIAQAIAFHLEDRRAAQGRPVPVSGYSGRNSK